MRTLHLTLLLAGALCAQDPPATKPPAPNPAAPDLDEKAFAALHELTQQKAPMLTGTMIEIGDQQHYLSLPKDKQAPLPAVLIIHEWWGLNEHIKHWADRLAGEGYATLAVDLYRGKTGTKSDEAMALMKGVDTEQAKATLKAAFDFLGTDARIRATRRASLGWCFGGAWSLQLAIAEPKLDACVIYYGRLVDDPAQLARIHAPVLGVFGTKDPSIKQEVVDAFEAAMTKAGKACRVQRYEAQHAFANPSNPNYDQANASKAWAEARAFLREHLAAAPPAKAGGAPK